MRKHNGYTLVECLAAIAMIGTAMTVVAVSMSGMHVAYQQMQDDSFGDMEWQRLAVQLRTDAHQARSADQEGETDENHQANDLRLTLREKEVIRYIVAGRQIRREHSRNEKIVHRETYRLPENCTAHWVLKTDGPSSVASLELECDTIETIGKATHPVLQIDTAVGLFQPSPAPKTP